MIRSGRIAYTLRLPEQLLREASRRHKGHAKKEINPARHADGLPVLDHDLFLVVGRFARDGVNKLLRQGVLLVARQRVALRIVGRQYPVGHGEAVRVLESRFFYFAIFGRPRLEIQITTEDRTSLLLAGMKRPQDLQELLDFHQAPPLVLHQYGHQLIILAQTPLAMRLHQFMEDVHVALDS